MIDARRDAVVVGVDLAGPTNADATAVACFHGRGESLVYASHRLGVTDSALCDLVEELGSRAPVVLGLDAPLSYNPGGGDRPADRDLRRRLVKKGLHSGSVMPPTMTRMAYLTLRGIVVARMVERLERETAIAEVHPSGVLALGGAPVDAVAALKRAPSARERLLIWMRSQNIHDLPRIAFSDHEVAALATALGAWKWLRRRSAWIAPADPPAHPFDFAC